MAKRSTLTGQALKPFDAMKALKPGNEPPAPPAAAQEASEVDGRKGLTVRLSVEAWRQLKMMALRKGVTAHALLIEGLNKVFLEDGQPPIA